MTYRIPFGKPFIVGKELFYISQAVLGGQLAARGEFTDRCERWLAGRRREVDRVRRRPHP